VLACQKWTNRPGEFIICAIRYERRSPPRSAPGFPHAVRFYNDDRSLGRTVADFLEPGLRQSDPAIVIATAAHRMLIATELTERGINLPRLEAAGDLQMLDADQVLREIDSTTYRVFLRTGGYSLA